MLALRVPICGEPDLAAAPGFYTHVWGLAAAERAGGVVWLRGTSIDLKAAKPQLDTAIRAA